MSNLSGAEGRLTVVDCLSAIILFRHLPLIRYLIYSFFLKGIDAKIRICRYNKFNMGKQNIDKDKLINYWIVSSDDDHETMIAMFKAGRYNWSLFVGHLMIEKLLKAYYVYVKGDFPPLIHNLLRLAEHNNLILTEEQKKNLVTITAFNINVRYDDYNMSFQKKCTVDFTEQWIKNLKEMRLWIKALIKP
jgi:HEPN domain-containing protein